MWQVPVGTIERANHVVVHGYIHCKIICNTTMPGFQSNSQNKTCCLPALRDPTVVQKHKPPTYLEPQLNPRVNCLSSLLPRVSLYTETISASNHRNQGDSLPSTTYCYLCNTVTPRNTHSQSVTESNSSTKASESEAHLTRVCTRVRPWIDGAWICCRGA